MTFGVDTVGLAFPISAADTRGATATVKGFGTESEAHTYRRRLDGGGFLAWGMGDVAWVEASVPKRVGPTNIEAQSLEGTARVLHDLHAEACEYVTPCPGVVYRDREGVRVDGRDWRQASLKRLDVVRDFDQVAIGPLLDGLASIIRGRTVKVRRFADAEAGNSETLRVGVKSAWSTVLYDKHAETDGLAPPGRLRFEARLRDSFLEGTLVVDRHGHKLPDWRAIEAIGPEGLDDLGSERFRHVGFDRQVQGDDAFAHTLNACDLSPRQKRDLLAFLAADQLGVDLGFHRNTLRKYRQLAESLGITLGTRVAPELSVRLDLASGTQVLESCHQDCDE